MPRRGLAVIGTAVAGIERAFWRFPQLLKASWLPYLLGAVALVILEVFWWGQLGMDSWAPDVLRFPVWALATTPASLAVIRILWLDPPARHEPPDWQPYAWAFGSVVIAASSFAELALDTFRFELFKLGTALLGIDIVDRSSEPILNRLGAAYELLRLVIKAFVAMSATGLLCAIAIDRAIGPNHWKRWTAMAPVRLLLLGVVNEAALAGLRIGDGIVLGWWKLVDPPPLGMLPWRTHVLSVLRLEMVQLPAVFISNVLSFAILVEGYRRLAGARTA